LIREEKRCQEPFSGTATTNLRLVSGASQKRFLTPFSLAVFDRAWRMGRGMRQFMRLCLFGLFLGGLSLCLVAGLPLFECVGDEMGWQRSRLACAIAEQIDPAGLRYMSAWGALVVVLVPFSFAALDVGRFRSATTCQVTHLDEPDIEQIYHNRQVDFGGEGAEQ